MTGVRPTRARWAIPHVTCPARLRLQGSALIVCLLMLIVVSMLGVSAAQIALQEEKASRNDRDRQIALEAAEAALRDAELDIEMSSRSHLFAHDKSEGFSEECGNGLNSEYLGLCLRAPSGATPVWQRIDLASKDGQARSVPYGRFTGRTLQTGEGMLSTEQSRYIIELIPSQKESIPDNGTTYLYRITSIGFGLRGTTRVVLQSFYRKRDERSENVKAPTGRLSWREIPNWQELHDVFKKG